MGEVFARFAPMLRENMVMVGRRENGLISRGLNEGLGGSNEDSCVDALRGQILSSNEEELSGPLNILERQFTESSWHAPGTGTHWGSRDGCRQLLPSESFYEKGEDTP